MSDQMKTTEDDKKTHRTGVSASIVAVLLLFVAAFGALHYLVPSATAGQSERPDNQLPIVEPQRAADPVDRRGVTPSNEPGPAQLPRPRPASNELTDSAKTPLEDVRSIRLKLDSALKRYGSNHSKVLSLRKRLLQMEQPIGEVTDFPSLPQADDLFGSVRGSAKQRFDAEQRRFQTQIDRLKRRVAELERKLHQRAENRDAIIRRRRQPDDAPMPADGFRLPGRAVTPEEEASSPALDIGNDTSTRARNLQPKPGPTTPSFDGVDELPAADGETFTVPAAEPEAVDSFPPGNVQRNGTVVGPQNGTRGTRKTRGNVDGATEPDSAVSSSRSLPEGHFSTDYLDPVDSLSALGEAPVAEPVADFQDVTEKVSLSDILCARIKTARRQSEELKGKQMRTADDEERLAGVETEIKVLAQQIAQQQSLVLKQVEQTKTTVKRMLDAMKSLKQAGFSDAFAEQRMNARIKSLQKRTADLQEEAQRLTTAGPTSGEGDDAAFDDAAPFEFNTRPTDSEPESLPEPAANDFPPAPTDNQP